MKRSCLLLLWVAACSPGSSVPENAPTTLDNGPARIPQLAPSKLADDAIYSVGEWPRFPQPLAAGEGRDITESVCTACHSTAYIIGQPPLSEAAWTAEVRKMIDGYGATVPADAEAKIITYLTAQYGPTRRVEEAPKVDTSRGLKIYGSNCVPCHQLAGTGVPGAFPPLAGHVPELLQTDAGRTYLPRVVLYGLTGALKVKGNAFNNMMTPFGHLSDEDLAAVLNYVATAWGNNKELKTFKPFVAADVAAQRKETQTPQTVFASRPKL